MFCSGCGTKNSDDHNFCRQCGHKLEKILPTKISEEAFDRALPEEEQKAVLLEHAYDRKVAGDLPGAILLAEEALAMNPESSEANSLLGQLYESSGDRSKAIAHYEKVVALNPGSIADRMKLDQFKNERRDTVSTAQNRVLMVDHEPKNTKGYAALAGIVATIGVITLLSALYVNSLKGKDASADAPVKSNVATGFGDLNSRNALVRNTGGSPIVQPPSGASQERTAETKPPVASNAAVLKASAPVAPATERIFYYPSSMSPGQSLPKMMEAGLPKNGFNAKSAPKPTRNARPEPKELVRDEDEGSGRIRLNVSSDRTKASDSGETIRITPKNVENGSAVASNDTVDKSPGSIRVKTNTSPSPASNEGEPAGTNASKMIAFGEEKMNQGAYADAITAFGRALSDANDQLGYVYSRLAKCYEMKEDKSNALSNYRKGEAEYHRMINSGIQTERAKDGLRICQNGIKICSVE